MTQIADLSGRPKRGTMKGASGRAGHPSDTSSSTKTNTAEKCPSNTPSITSNTPQHRANPQQLAKRTASITRAFSTKTAFHAHSPAAWAELVPPELRCLCQMGRLLPLALLLALGSAAATYFPCLASAFRVGCLCHALAAAASGPSGTSGTSDPSDPRFS